MSGNFWSFVTRLGDSSLLLPLAALLAAALWRYDSTRVAWQWMRAVAVCAAVLVALKLLFLSYGHRWYERLESPSGHAGIAILVYGGLAIVLANQLSLRLDRQWATRWRITLALLATALAAVIAVSRKVIGVHSVAEVLLGGMLGMGTLLLFLRDYRTTRHRVMPLTPLCATGLLLLILAPLWSFTPETYLWRAAQRIKAELRAPVPHSVCAPGRIRGAGQITAAAAAAHSAHRGARCRSSGAAALPAPRHPNADILTPPR